jgi:hypothetical protein
MPEIVADPPWASCYHLFSGTGIQKFNDLVLIPFGFARQPARCALSPPGEI